MANEHDVEARRKTAIDAIDELFRMKDGLMREGPADDATQRKAMAETDRLFVALTGRPFVSSGLGECQMARPYSTLRAVLRDDKIFYCCGHDPRHCVQVAP